MLAEAKRRGQELPFLSLLREIVETCELQGEGGRDNSVTIEEIRRRKTTGKANVHDRIRKGAAGGQ